MSPYRRRPLPLGPALDALADELQPNTALAAVQRIWVDAVGEQLACYAAPTAERGGVLTVSCEDSMWAQEVDLMSPQILSQLNARLADAALTRLRCTAVGHGH